MKRLIIILICLIYSNNFFAQDVQVTAKFDTSSILIGDQIYFTIKIDKPAGTNIVFPVFKDTLYQKIEIISGPQTDSLQLHNGINSIISKYLITSFDSGFYQVPPVYAEIVSANGTKRFYSSYASLEVSRIRTAPTDSTDVIYDVIKPIKAPLTVGDIIPWFFCLIVIVFVTWYLIRLIRNSKKKIKTGDQTVIREPAHVIAFRDLEKLKNEDLWQNGEIKLYYTRLSEILRQYLENRYFISSMESTTEETLSIYNKTIKPDADEFLTLKSVLINADLVKFAKFKPLQSDNEISFENSWKFVSLTTPNPDIKEESSDKIEKKETREGIE